ncbi:TetR family transcriptional regulator [Roseospira marina]|uniref:TetR family transcriptional regulator n=1 Tax=Roseospira marina TaxID=140057 RepID=A0A5M6I909_9PROT|nr:TetR family transcriptional regulator [Roseospira marina]KAA5604681.1 TetR family transcriptional regulator [Roseospira marina]MBB4315128.1 AcrR family transcriptional regulator [Roseospira marina]MBB5088102.1 AcrR family transcriptional regulator [Roseospira marina]
MAKQNTTSHGSDRASGSGAADDVSLRLVDAGLGLAAESGWRRLTMAAIAERAGVPLHEALRVHGSRNEVLRAMGHAVDAAMLEEALTFTDQDGPRDRLFDMLMRRYDALSRWRPGLAAIIRDLPTDPVTFLVSMQGVYHSMGLALEAASLPADGFGGLATRKGLAAVYLATMRVWVDDDSEDLAPTMAALDKNLDRAQSVMKTLCKAMPCRPGRRRKTGGTDHKAGPEDTAGSDTMATTSPADADSNGAAPA